MTYVVLKNTSGKMATDKEYFEKKIMEEKKYKQWNKHKAYLKDDRVMVGKKLYEAKRWSNTNPVTNSGPW